MHEIINAETVHVFIYRIITKSLHIFYANIVLENQYGPKQFSAVLIHINMCILYASRDAVKHGNYNIF